MDPVQNLSIKIKKCPWTRFSRLLAEFHVLREAPRLGGARKLRKSTHPRKFGNHVTVHRPSSRTL